MAESVFDIGGVEGQVKELSDHIANLIKVYTKSFTSNMNGDVVTDLPDTKKVLGAFNAYVSGTYNGYWVLTYVTHDGGEANLKTVPSTTRTVSLYYVD